MSNQTIVLKNCLIVTVDKEDNYFHNGMLIIRNGIIDYVGPQIDYPTDYSVIDMSGKIIMPGLINTHTHSPAALFRGVGDDLFLMDWLQNYMWPVEKNMTAEDAYHGSRLSYLEFLRNGMTTNVDMWYFSDAVAQAAMSVGLRAVVAAGVFAWATPESADSLRDADDFVAKYIDKSAETFIYPCYGPHDAYSNTSDTLREVVKLSKARNTIIHTHLSETEENNEQILEEHGVTPTRFYEQNGVFERKVLAAHGIWLTDEDLKIFHENDAYVSYNPVSNLKLCDGILPVHRLKEAKVGFSLGVDGAQSNNSLDLLSDQKTGVLIQKMAVNDPTFFPARDAVRMITIDGAASIGMENEIGSLEQGKQADIISLDFSDVNLTPYSEDIPGQIYSHITYSATGANVSDVFVAGKQLLKNKEVIHSNPDEIKKQAEITSKRLYSLWRA